MIIRQGKKRSQLQRELNQRLIPGKVKKKRNWGGELNADRNSSKKVKEDGGEGARSLKSPSVKTDRRRLEGHIKRDRGGLRERRRDSCGRGKKVTRKHPSGENSRATRIDGQKSLSGEKGSLNVDSIREGK